jgi:hypothetical protein
MRDGNGKTLPHYSPFPLPESCGTNVFNQNLNGEENYYCFPPFCLIGPVLKFLQQECTRPLKVSMIVPKLSPISPWWPGMVECSVQFLKIGKTGEKDVFLAPSKEGYTPIASQSDMYLFRLQFS